LLDEWISAEFQNLAEVINDYDPDLYLEMVPKEHWDQLVDKKKVFRVVDGRNKKIVLYAEALSRPDEILAALWSMDQKHGSVVIRMETLNAAQKALDMKKQMDERGELMDFVKFIGKNQKSRWEHDGKIYNEEFRNLGPKKTVIK
jgi:hypothetical protein